MNDEDISSKRLTLQGSGKLKLASAVLGATIGTTIVKKRRKRLDEENIDHSHLSSLTEQEQISRIHAVQNAALLKSHTTEENDKDTFVEETEKFVEESVEAVDEKEEVPEHSQDNSEDSKKKSAKISKDVYSKHSKLIIEQAIDERVEQNFRQKFGIRNKKSKFTKGKNISREVIVPDNITIKELSIRMAENSKNVLKLLKEDIGENYMIGDLIDPDIACKIVKKFGHIAKRVSETSKEKNLLSLDNRGELSKEQKSPVVTFMGHVNHGKTSLLDALRQSNIAKSEAGGITQHIGAYQMTTATQQKITFIDTPGHQAFTEIRARGANITNIVVIVIAADDGINDQTTEAINHAKAAGVPIIVAINKIDKSQPGDVEKITNKLPEHGLIPDNLDGDVIVIPVSAKKRINLDKLEEAILLIAELMDLQAIVDCRALGWVIEARKDKAKGISATLIVEEGTLKIGDTLVAGTTYGKVRNMVNHLGKSEKAALPSTPVEITGLNDMPYAGDKFVVVQSEKQAREIVAHRLELVKRKKENLEENNPDMFLSNDKKMEELAVILKCDVTGSINAISNSIDKLGKDQIKVNILHKAVGGITDSDILLAEASHAVILAFNIKIDSRIKDLAKQKGIKIYSYNIIYDLIDDMKSYLTNMLKPVTREVQIGSAVVRQIFGISKAGSVIGCYVNNGVIRRDSMIQIIRNNKLLNKGKLKALRRFKDDVKEVGANFECGMLIESKADIKVNDILEAYQLIEETATL
ncbi:translation initiation factor IF-2 [Wolbachia pipientis]|uniref:Translation initiation factor IF-2 n=1 Tax=Wolbachia pipientis TaxID=955 RepID=A0A1E7QK51_WOLPI|nr:translation initiation factor IF-2 [Wolbachia pipientis]OEY86852.1 translation initiation factor IF-2 [Wolbachia pipientis]